MKSFTFRFATRENVGSFVERWVLAPLVALSMAAMLILMLSLEASTF